MKPPVLRPAAAADVEEAWLWYEAQREGLGDEFLDVVQSALESLSAHAESAPVVQRDLRRQLLKRFPYGLFYKLIEELALTEANATLVFQKATRASGRGR